MPESSACWFKTYSGYHVHKLQMTPTTLDPGLLFQRGRNTIDGILGDWVDDTICASTSSFSDEEDVASNECLNKAKIFLTETAVNFNGIESSKTAGDNNIIINQRNYIKQLRNIILD